MPGWNGLDQAARNTWLNEKNAPALVKLAGKAGAGLPDQSRPALAPDVSQAVRDYTGRSDKLNNALRGQEPMTPDLDALHQKLESAMGQTKPFAKPVNVISGRMVPGSKLPEFLQKIKDAQARGQPLEVPGYLSTSVGKTIADDFTTASVVFKIAARQGLDASPHTEFTGAKEDERELLLPHNSKFRVKGMTTDKNGVHHVQLEQIPLGTPSLMPAKKIAESSDAEPATTASKPSMMPKVKG